MASKIVWDPTGSRLFETGIDRVVLFLPDVSGGYTVAHAWNGITAITESPSGAEATALYADNIEYASLVSREKLAGSIEAYTYPNAFTACDGNVTPVLGVNLSQQSRSRFGLAYRTLVGNDLVGDAFGYKLHLLYGCLAAPSSRAYNTQAADPEAIKFSWDFTTLPVAVTGQKPTSLITIDSATANAAKLAALEVILYGVAGTPGTDARLPLPDEIVTLMTPPAG